MTDTPTTPHPQRLDDGGARALLALRRDLRSRLRTLWRAWNSALPPGQEVRYAAELSPPRWELGHLAWFEERWINRNPQRLRGPEADPSTPRGPSLLPRSDAWFDPAQHSHAQRWHLDLPLAARLEAWMDAVRERSDALLRQVGDADDALWTFRLAALHEAEHLESWLAMAQALALDLRGCGLSLNPGRVTAAEELELPASGSTPWTVGPGGFVLGHERGVQAFAPQALRIDATPVTWSRYLPFVETGGYEQARWWTAEGWAWRKRLGLLKPSHLVRGEGHAGACGPWRWARFGQWEDLDPDTPATHLSAHEAQAWCAWAGRRLPTEGEWLHAATTAGAAFLWGGVREWTATPFEALPGQTTDADAARHVAGLGQHRVLKGASFASAAPLVDLRRRAHLAPGRTDRFTGFRSCA